MKSRKTDSDISGWGPGSSRLNAPTYSIIEEVLDIPGNNIFAKVATPNLVPSPKLFNLNGRPTGKKKSPKDKSAPKKSYFKQVSEDEANHREAQKRQREKLIELRQHLMKVPSGIKFGTGTQF